VINMSTLDFYLQKGFDKKTAEYFASGRKKIVGVTPKNGKKLELRFNNGEVRILDISPIIKSGTVFAFLEDEKNFNRVYIDDTASVSWDIDPNIDSNVVWNNKVDLCPDTCYIDSVPIDG